MKNFARTILTGILSIIGIIGFAQTGNSIKAKVVTATGAINFVAQQVVVKKSPGNKNSFQLIGISNQGRIQIKIDKEVSTGTYAISNKDRKIAFLFSEPRNANPYSTIGKCADATGTLTITQISATEVKGKFSFTGKGMFAKCDAPEKALVTEGEFSAKF